MKKSVLLIEDEMETGHLVALHLRDLGCRVTFVGDGASGLEQARCDAYDLIILDLVLQDIGGLDVCRQLRLDRNYVPILVLAPESTGIDPVRGLELGADDYLTKPFSTRELAARVKALLRRVEVFDGQRLEDKENRIQVDDLTIDVDKRTVTLAGRRVGLTAKEFELLLQFARHPGKVYTRGELLDLVWGYSYSGYEHTVSSHVYRLRSKIEENPTRPQHLLTVWGVGYKLCDPEPPGSAAISP